MKNFRIILCLLMSTLFVSSAVNAALYKWVDENGKVHYSDKVPDDQVESDVVPVESKSDPGADSSTNASSAKAIIRPYEKTARKLHLLDTRLFWKRESEIEKTSKIGVYHTGKGCTPRGAMKMPDVLIHQKNLFPRDSSLTSRIRKVINGLDYDSERTERYDLFRKLKKSGGLSLHSEIVEMDFNTCAPNLRKSERLNSILKVSSGRFTKHRIRLKIKWTLKSDRDQKIVYETITEGRYSGWRKTTSAGLAMLDAAESSALKLFADKDFITKILIQEDIVDLEAVSMPELKPIRSKGKLKTRELYVSLNEDNWLRKLKPGQQVGNLLFGSNCSSSRTYSQLDASNRKIEYLPTARKASDIIIKNVRALGYTINPAGSNSSDVLNANGYSLQAELVKITHDACAPSLSASTKFKSVDKLNVRKLTRKRSAIQIKWTLKSNGNRNTVYQTITEGAAGSLLTESSSAEVMQAVVAMSARRLFADQNFVDKLAIKKSQNNLVSEPFENVPQSVNGIVNPDRNSQRHIFIVSSDDPWRLIPTNKVIGYYSYGSQCTPYKGRKWPNAVNDHAKLFLRNNEIAGAQAKVIKSLAYKYQMTDQYNVVNMKRKLGGYSLHFDIFEIRYDSCAPNESESVIAKNKKISSSRFKRHRARVEILWRLVGEDEQKPLFETSTSGVADSWLLNSSGKKVLSAAIEDATARLFAEKPFVDRLTAVEEGEGLFTGLFSFLASDDDGDSQDEIAPGSQQSYLLKAHTAQTLSEMNTLKIMMLEHYFSMGNWPDNLSDMGLSESMFQNSKTISHIDIQGDGSIVAELKDLMGKDKIIKLTPIDDSGSSGIGRWECSSNIPRHALVSACETF